MSQLGRYESRTIEASQPEYPWRCKSCGKPETWDDTSLCEDCLERQLAVQRARERVAERVA